MRLPIRNFLQWLAMMCAIASLNGCFGGTVAQQIAQSIATSLADNAVANAVENSEKQEAEKQKRTALEGDVFGEYWGAFATSGFEQVKPIEKPLPEKSTLESNRPRTTQLVRVQLISLLAGEEKNAALQKAYPFIEELTLQTQQLKNWRVGTGILDDPTQQPIVFLIPPDLEKLPSGSITMVEVSRASEVYIARYLVN